ncbi:MAG: hypothetical protein Q9170_005655 [Blastenia crenularia]
MSRFGRDPRHSSGDLAYGDFYERESSNGGGRWDPERFARERERASRARGPALVERDRYEEHDYYESPRGSQRSFGGRRRESSADGSHVRDSGRGAPFRFEERDKYIFEDSYGPPARRQEPGRYHEEDIDTFVDSPARGPLVSFEQRRRSIHKDAGPPPRRAPPRPGIIRRQSSLDTFDRRPLLRYGDRVREPPETIVIPNSIKRRSSPPRYMERDFEESKVRGPERFDDQEFRGYREREISTTRRRRADSEVEFVEKETFEIEEDEPEKAYPRKGKTKMPVRLVNKRAIIELGYPFEQEGETIIILKALAKEHIDEVIKISKEMNEREESRTTYVIEAPPPPPEPEIIERRTTEILVSPPQPSNMPPSIRDWDDGHSTLKAGSVAGGHSGKGGHSTHGGHSVSGKSRHGSKSTHGGHSVAGGKSTHGRHSIHGGHSRSRSKSHHGGHSEHHSPSGSSSSSPSPPPIEIIRSPSRSRRRSRSTVHKEIVIDPLEGGESNAMPGLQLVVPRRSKSTNRDERRIRAEIRALEEEKKMLKHERDASRYRERDTEVIIERERDRDRDRDRDVKIEKDKKGRMSLVR